MQSVRNAAVLKQSQADTGLACLVMLARYHGVAVSAEQLAHQYGQSDSRFTHTQILLAARRLGLMAKSVKSSIKRLQYNPLPAILQSHDGHFFILAAQDKNQWLIHDPSAERPEALNLEQLGERWNGQLILIRSQASIAGELARFDFTWFIPAIIKYRKLLGEVLLVSFALQLFALLTPLFFQVVMDKVLVHHSATTLNVIVIGLLAIMLFESLLPGLRSYLFSHTTSRIDVELSSKLFNHLLALPIAWFQAICRGRTVIIIAHRLSAVRHANRILVMERGQIIESGAHQELLQKENGHYRDLHQLQQG